MSVDSLCWGVTSAAAGDEWAVAASDDGVAHVTVDWRLYVDAVSSEGEAENGITERRSYGLVPDSIIGALARSLVIELAFAH